MRESVTVMCDRGDVMVLNESICGMYIEHIKCLYFRVQCNIFVCCVCIPNAKWNKIAATLCAFLSPSIHYYVLYHIGVIVIIIVSLWTNANKCGSTQNASGKCSHVFEIESKKAAADGVAILIFYANVGVWVCALCILW